MGLEDKFTDDGMSDARFEAILKEHQARRNTITGLVFALSVVVIIAVTTVVIVLANNGVFGG